ncbi:RagB/SusD family nutrient uptake outer membrane protein [Chitinophaga pendula]|uniref:RagB/SusD family nutrient uptake outer membrane protein n=1 Tax=Chitinophaga TaxID=79328 RepID=UPI000BAFADD0|nr:MULTISPECIES: RagB/SusD family nutrient uptake outer membrane protein [Chitinophaga]ASZ12024.1 hypothetical protein CK934_14170 [Chitinophaga sp. MD30]UCJ04943.1 RagB/SusD family nutrient uptake outer membrane protein [Chitinophaga pendula]
MNSAKYLLIMSLTLSWLTTLTGCKKLLDQDPINSPYNDVFWKDEKDALQSLAGGYALLRRAMTTNTDFGGYMSHFSYGDLTANEFSSFEQYDLDFLVKGGKGFSMASFIGDYLGNYQDWTPYYKVITQSNIILHNVPAIPDNKFKNDPQQTRNKIMGEALFLRAYSYFYMVRLWGDVPLVTAYDEDPAKAQPIPRTSEKIILDSCIRDLQRAIPLLTWDYKDGAEKNVRANRGAAYALMAHVYMWKDFLNKGTVRTDLTNAINAVNEVQNSAKYRLIDTSRFATLFQGKSDEGIFEINMQVAQNEQQTESGFYYKCLMEPYIKGKTSMNGRLNRDLITDIYKDKSDFRYRYFFDFTLEANPILTKYAGRNSENIFYKDLSNYTQAAVNANIIVFRYADLLLLRAEANAKLQDFGMARNDLNEVRKRSGLSAYAGNDADLYTEVFRERSRELYCEASRWYDLVRTGFLKTEKDGSFGTDRYNQEGWKWPIGRSLFLNNYVLKQNKFWEGKVN